MTLTSERPAGSSVGHMGPREGGLISLAHSLNGAIKCVFRTNSNKKIYQRD